MTTGFVALSPDTQAIVGRDRARSGLYSVAASSGHWDITHWLLHFSLGSSVRTHALGIEVPDLDAPRLVRQGAGHFHTGCAP